ncbi:MAG: HPr kinase/phosphatase C-terminal domain-containing protein [Pseudomonadota bacterium]
MGPAKIQGVLVNVLGVGVLIRGPSGVGKSFAALRLMDRGHKLVADDLLEVTEDREHGLIGKGLEPVPRIEIRGLGIYEADSLFPGRTVSSSTIDLIVDLGPYVPDRDAGRTEPDVGLENLLGSRVTRVRLPLPTGADPGLTIELLAGIFMRNGRLQP